jgi:ribonuclease-3
MQMQMDKLEREKQHERNIYNPANVLFSKKDLFLILDKAGVVCDAKIKDKIARLNLSDLQVAFNHKSYCIHHIKTSDELKEEAKGWAIKLQETSNERFEFLGDSVIDLIIAEYLFDRFPREKEGFLTRLRTKLVCTKTLAKFGAFLNLTRYIIMSKYVEDICEGRDNPKLLENCFESFVGVAYKLLGLRFVQQLVVSLLENVELVDLSDMIENDDNYKDQLLRYCHKHFDGRNPVYKQLHVEGQSNHAIFTMCVLVPVSGETGDNMRQLALAKAANKKEAEQESARLALDKLKRGELF